MLSHNVLVCCSLHSILSANKASANKGAAGEDDKSKEGEAAEGTSERRPSEDRDKDQTKPAAAKRKSLDPSDSPAAKKLAPGTKKENCSSYTGKGGGAKRAV